MKNFLVQYHTPKEAVAPTVNTTPEQKAEVMKPWMAWQQVMGERKLDFGAPMRGKVRLNPKGKGPSNQSDLNGYSILPTKEIEEAVSILKSHPHLQCSDQAALETFDCSERKYKSVN